MVIEFEIVGIPTHPPEVGDTYQLALIFERTNKSFNPNYEPLVDAVWVNWTIGNGPRAAVNAVDTYAYAGNSGADLADHDELANNWHVRDWTDVMPYTCQKIDSEGCDVLTAKIYKYWFEYNSLEDISLQDGTFLVSLYTRKCPGPPSQKDLDCVVEQYDK
jgi:hypothetical protein